MTSLHSPMAMKALVLVLAVMFAACATDEGAPTADDLDALDQWSQAADGKSDLPATWTELVTWLRHFYRDRMSAIWSNQEHPATADAALARIQVLLAQKGITDLSTVRLHTTVQRLRTELIDHSEIDISLPGAVIRLVGDPKGAGAFVDRAVFKTSVGPPLCLTWAELETAVRASYVEGAYAVDYVCHTVTEHVLRALRIGTARYDAEIRTYAAARWIWGPILPSGNPQDPSAWPESRTCN